MTKKPHVKLVSPATKNRTVTPRRRPNADMRTREYLTDAEVVRLMDAGKRNRYGHRDATMILTAYRHGMRAAELVDLRWDQVDFNAATLAVRRVKKGSPSTHPIRGDELRALRKLERQQEPKSPFVFTSERSGTVHTGGVCSHGGAGGDGCQARLQGASPYATPCLRLRLGEQGRQYQGAASLSRPSNYPAYRSLYRAISRSI
jgi:integrase